MKNWTKRGEGVHVDLSLYCFNFCQVHIIMTPPPEMLTNVKGA